MNRLYYFFLLASMLVVASCSSDDSPDVNRRSLSSAPESEGQSASTGTYVSRLLAPPGYERGAGYCYATGADYLEGVTFNIFNLNYLDSIQYVKGLNFVSDDYTPYSEEQVITGETRSAVSQQLALSASVGVNFIVADIKVTGNYSKGSVQEEQSVFAMKRTKRVAYCRDIQYKNIIMYYKETGDSMVFAPGFYADWKKLEGTGTNQTDVSNQMVLDFSENMSAEMAINASVGLLIGVEASASTQTQQFQTISRDRYSLDIHVRGGDVQAVTEVLAGTSTSPQGIQEWMASVNFPPVPNNEQLKTCAMTDVKIASMAYLFTGKVQDRVNYILRTYAQ